RPASRRGYGRGAGRSARPRRGRDRAAARCGAGGVSGIGEADIAAWRAHVGRSEHRRQLLDAESLRRFAAATGADLDVERDPPPLAHWAWFLDTVPDDRLGPDGHPRRGGFLPAITLP